MVATIAAGMLLVFLIFHSDALQQRMETQKSDNKSASPITQAGAGSTAGTPEKAAAAPQAASDEKSRAATDTTLTHPREHPDAH